MTAVLTRVIAVPVLLAGALGALGGWLWWQWWSPAPTGQVYDTAEGRRWFPTPFDPGIARDFSGTATYVVLGIGLAFLLGVVAALVARDKPVPGLVAVGAASVLAAVVMLLVGASQSPADPQEKADDVAVGTKLPGHLHVTNGEISVPGGPRVELPTPYLVWPVGAMLGYLVVLLAVLNPDSAGRSPAVRWPRPEPLSAAPARQD